MLRNVRVIAIDQRLESKAGEAVPAHTATFEVTPKQSEVIALASEIGKVSLSLRSLVPDPRRSAADANSQSPMRRVKTHPIRRLPLRRPIRSTAKSARFCPKRQAERRLRRRTSVTILRGGGKGSESATCMRNLLAQGIVMRKLLGSRGRSIGIGADVASMPRNRCRRGSGTGADRPPAAATAPPPATRRPPAPAPAPPPARPAGQPGSAERAADRARSRQGHADPPAAGRRRRCSSPTPMSPTSRSRSPTLIYVSAKAPGETVLYAVDSDDHVLLNAPVRVEHDLSRVRAVAERDRPRRERHGQLGRQLAGPERQRVERRPRRKGRAASPPRSPARPRAPSSTGWPSRPRTRSISGSRSPR